MMPTRIRLTMLLSRELSERMSSKTRKAPMKAAMLMPIVDHQLKPTRALPPSKTTKATPKLAPLLIPKMDGSAKGLRKSVCINKPETERPMPANKAVMACGKRKSMMMERKVESSASKTALEKSFQLIDTEPIIKFKTNKNNPKIRMAIKIGVLCRFVCLFTVQRY